MADKTPEEQRDEQVQSVLGDLISQLLAQAYPDLNEGQKLHQWQRMHDVYDKAVEAGGFQMFELDRGTAKETGSPSSRDDARRKLFEHIAKERKQQLKWIEGDSEQGLFRAAVEAANQAASQDQSNASSGTPEDSLSPQSVASSSQPPIPPAAPPSASPAGEDPEEENRNHRLNRTKMLLKELKESASYQRVYGTPQEEWTAEDRELASELQAKRLELETAIGEYAMTPEPRRPADERISPRPGRRERSGNSARDAYYEEHRQQRTIAAGLERENTIDAQLADNPAGDEYYAPPVPNDLEQAAAMERNAPPSPKDMAGQSGQKPRNFWQRARQAAVDAGFANRPDVPEAFQTDEWKAANAPLDQQEKWQMGLDMAAIGGFSYLGRQALGGVTSFFTDKGTGQVLNDVTGTAGQGFTNVATGAMAGMQLGGPAGAAVGAVVGAGATIATLPQKILEWSQALLDSREHLAQWSGQLQAMRREAEMRGISRDIDSARETAPAANMLNRTVQDLLDEVRPIKDEIFKISAVFATGAVKATTLFMKYGPKFEDVLRTIPGIKDSFIPSLVGIIRKAMPLLDKLLAKEEANDTTVQRWADTWRRNPTFTNRVPRR